MVQIWIDLTPKPVPVPPSIGSCSVTIARPKRYCARGNRSKKRAQSMENAHRETIGDRTHTATRLDCENTHTHTRAHRHDPGANHCPTLNSSQTHACTLAPSAHKMNAKWHGQSLPPTHELKKPANAPTHTRTHSLTHSDENTHCAQAAPVWSKDNLNQWFGDLARGESLAKLGRRVCLCVGACERACVCVCVCVW